jgi:hypothetical protein
MRRCMLVVICVVVASCGKKSSPAPAGKLVEQMPEVDNAAALAPASIALPRVVAFVAADGTITANDRSKSWDTFLAQDPRRKAIPVDAAYLDYLVHMADDVTPLAKLHEAAGGVAPTPPPAVADDDPPPPPPEEEEDDGEEESGGTGSTVMLDEGKMGRKAPPDPPPTPAELRHEALAQAGLDGVYGVDPTAAGLAARTMEPRMGPVPPELPRRLGFVIGETLEEPMPDPLPRLLVVAAPGARASALVDVLRQNPALLGVAHQGTVRALRIAILQQGDRRQSTDWRPWTEVRVTATSLQVEGVPGPATELAAFDAKALADAFVQQREARGLTDRVDVDVLVAADVDVQRLVDVLVALDGAGARIYSLGRLPAAGDAELAKRGKRVPTIQLRPIVSAGELSKTALVETLVTVSPQVKACYETGLATKPDLAGLVSTQFFISPNGTVTASYAQGVDGEVAACIAGVIKGLEFPKPGGGGGVQVNAPFILRR